MAWKFRLTDEISNAGDKIAIHGEYYDDTAPSTVLHTENFAFDPSVTNGQMQSMVQERGAAVRTARNRATSLASSFPQASTVINIP